jgi:hypothetical protein
MIEAFRLMDKYDQINTYFGVMPKASPATRVEPKLDDYRVTGGTGKIKRRGSLRSAHL